MIHSLIQKLTEVENRSRDLEDDATALRSAKARLEDRVELLEQSAASSSSDDLLKLLQRKDDRIRELEQELLRARSEQTQARPRIPSSPIPPPIVSKPLLTRTQPSLPTRREPQLGSTSEARRRSTSKNRLAQSISGPLAELKPVLSTRKLRKSLLDRN